MTKKSKLPGRGENKSMRNSTRKINRPIEREKLNRRSDCIFTEAGLHRVRVNMAEFANAGKAGKLLRTALSAVLKKVNGYMLVPRLTGEMNRVIKAGLTKHPGNRNASDGDIALLQGFEFNKNAGLSSVFRGSFVPHIDRNTGILQADIHPFAAREALRIPAGARQYCLFIAGCSIDFLNENFTTTSATTDLLPINEMVTGHIHLSCSVPADSRHPLFLVMGIEFMQVFNGNRYALKDTSGNAMAIVKVSKC